MKSIGIFDSGIGGLTVFSEVEKVLPDENLIYLGDTARVPYGTKSKETIERFSWEIVQFLLQHDVKFIIAACNTVSALALPFLKKHLDIPILGVIEPAVKAAYEASTGYRIGVIGTPATIRSQVYEYALYRMDDPEHILAKIADLPDQTLKVYSAECPLFVPLVEEGWIDEPETFSIARKYLGELRSGKIDTLILGCTHYPLLRPVIQKIIGPDVTLIDSAHSTALVAAEMISKMNLAESTKMPEKKFFVTDDPKRFRWTGEQFLGRAITQVDKVCLESPERILP